MIDLPRRRILSGAIALAGAGLFAKSATAQINVEVIVPKEPPTPRDEVVPQISGERAEQEQWQPGYWQWTDHEHVWKAGRYVEPPNAGDVWVPGNWVKRRGGWAYEIGRWN